MDKKRRKILRQFQRAIGYRFKNQYLLNTALTHKSYAFEQNKHRPEWNERLEFLGDAVLGLAVSGYLYGKYRKSQEGDLTKLKSALVCTENLEKKGHALNIGEYLLLGRGEERGGGRRQTSNLCCVVEALIGAVYLDRDFKAAEKFVLHLLRHDLADISQGRQVTKDYKSSYQEYCLKRFGKIPHYEVISQSGPEHKKEFVIRVSISGAPSGSGWGFTKKTAEQMAAKEALKNLKY